MIVPKRKTSKQRKALRRSHHALKPATLALCNNCKQAIIPHTICEFCGFYKGKKEIKEAINDKIK
ncbi:50S ribosomal protein L32 [Metamycoplasma hyosynoviae]|uniref:Large ribosomal subunit protein bL32 n=1 Tax=Metamycoplasma hyosynoviae TaxID=29559 RepID=A0A063Y6F0_9BACT|nr:50S ribosomal protein L32 [Metamycoplasma hyosynoviae]ASI53932.1 50S ribosomal protein L32 [Metamycoplasma hyosynoviae]KDE41948.1 50S ribosomal protein L32 [Metamycoplasma hyosynoviae]KDE41995.1 50S ribosomal protein L32 [Metamycoplasma hyosynoviae]KDE43240.1 50S ribosomal protein L32 [Metamycoplasma hyosynoviae]KDE43356.1 50S ribosomal protein L32 [Metamycoplasma hyosynoviae]